MINSRVDCKNIMFLFVSGTAYARYTFEHRNGSDLMTFESVRTMCDVDNRLRQLSPLKNSCFRPSTQHKHCCRTWSLSNYVALLANRTQCSEISRDDVSALRQLLARCVQFYENETLEKCQYDDVTRGRTSCASVPSECLRHGVVFDVLHYIADSSFLRLEADGKTRTPRMRYAMSFLPHAVGKEAEALYLAFKDEESQLFAHKSSVRIVALNFGLKEFLFDYYIAFDSVYFCAALLAVVAIMWVYTKSFFLTVMAALSIIISVVISFCLYSCIYGIQFFPYMNLMALVLLVGIGADDVFLYCRVWCLAKRERNVGTLEKVVSDTLRHAALSMFVTSFTTAAALLANITSDITALKCFSIFSSTAVIVIFLMMLTWIPASIVIHDKYFAQACFYCSSDAHVATTTEHNNNNSSNSKANVCSQICRVVCELYSRLKMASRTVFECILPYVVIRMRYLWLAIFGGLGVAGVFIVLYYPKLRLPSSFEFQVFARTHPFEVYDFVMKENFDFELVMSSNSLHVPITVVWGVHAQDTGDKLDPHGQTQLRLVDGFNMYTEAAQLTLLRFCHELRLSAWYQATPGISYTNCLMQPFRDYMKLPCFDLPGEENNTCCGHTQFPFPPQLFRECLQQWLIEIERTRHLPFFYVDPDVGPRYSKETGEVVALVTQVHSKQTFSFNYRDMNHFYKSVNSWVEANTEQSPPELASPWFVSDLDFYDLQASLANGTPVAIGVSITIATIVALLTTRNVLITLWAMLSISATIFVVVAILVLIGWQLNVLEAVTLTVAVGLAMDFTLHYGMGYRLATDPDRESRVISSMTRIGSPVAMAALSTFTAGAFVLPATIQACRQLGVFLLIVTSVSWTYSTFFFQSLLRAVGPIGDFSQFNLPSLHSSRCCDRASDVARVDKTVYRATSDSSLTSQTAAEPLNSISSPIDTQETDLCVDDCDVESVEAEVDFVARNSSPHTGYQALPLVQVRTRDEEVPPSLENDSAQLAQQNCDVPAERDLCSTCKAIASQTSVISTNDLNQSSSLPAPMLTNGDVWLRRSQVLYESTEC